MRVESFKHRALPHPMGTPHPMAPLEKGVHFQQVDAQGPKDSTRAEMSPLSGSYKNNTHGIILHTPEDYMNVIYNYSLEQKGWCPSINVITQKGISFQGSLSEFPAIGTVATFLFFFVLQAVL